MEAIDKVREALEAASGGDPAKRRNLMQLASRFSPHASVTRPLISRKAPYAVPAPSDELDLLIEALCEELAIADSVLAAISNPRSIEIVNKFRKEVLWALAVLWFAPPAADAAQVEKWLDRECVTAQVRPFRDQLATLHRGSATPAANAPGGSP